MRADNLNPAGGRAEPGCSDDPGDLRLRLRALSDRAEPPFGFEELQRRAHASGRMGAIGRWRARQPALWLLAGAVAAVAAGLGLYHRSVSASGPTTAANPSTALPAAAVQPGTTGAALYLRQRPQRALVNVDSQVPVMALEDRIAVVDDQLNAARLRQPRARQVAVLMRDRAQLVQSLAQVRYAQDLVEMP